MRILSAHGIALARTLEQKISDAGPANQRIDPHILTPARNKLISKGKITKITAANTPWYHLADTPLTTVQNRLDEQLPVLQSLQSGTLGSRIGQCLEIAIYKALLRQDTLEHFGSFTDLEKHDDSTLYSKEEPPQALSGRRLPGDQRVDFLIRHPDAGWAAIESKNVRAWLYPNCSEITDLLGKATDLDVVPVLIARRLAFVTFKVLSTCGVLFHQTYNQLLPDTERELADKAKDKRLLGYHDIRIGNEPDKRLATFVTTNLPRILPEARCRFDDYKNLLADFAAKTISYQEFAARVSQPSGGLCEDGDWDPSDDHI